MFKTTHEEFMTLLDEMENDAIITISSQGYRLSHRVFKGYLYNKNTIKEEIINHYICNYGMVTDTEKKKRGEGEKQGSLTELLSLKFSGNLAFDIVMVIFWILSGSGKKYVTTDEFLYHLSKGWVFLD